MSDRFPVWVSVTRDDGRVEQVRVGSAVKTGEGFTVAFDAMVIGPTPMSAAPRAPVIWGSGGRNTGRPRRSPMSLLVPITFVGFTALSELVKITFFT